MLATYYSLLFVSAILFINGGFALDSKTNVVNNSVVPDDDGDDDGSSGVDPDPDDAPARITRTTTEGCKADKSSKCKKYKKKGYCNDMGQYEDWMQKNCYMTCGFCAEDVTSEDAKRRCFETHNIYRANHTKTNKLVWDSGLAKQAQAYANVLVKQRTQRHDDKRGKNIGENLASADWPTQWGKYTCEQALQDWYNEYKDYDFDTGEEYGVVGHFTQMVWTTSKKVGLGVAIERFGDVGDERVFYQVVGRYEPKGNWDVFTKHVMKFKSKSERESEENGASTVTKECKDYNEKCKEYKKKNYCTTKYVKWMKDNCYKTCGYCEEKEVSTVTQGKECKDLTKTCKKHKAKGYCTRYINWMIKHCQKTCGFCM